MYALKALRILTEPPIDVDAPAKEVNLQLNRKFLVSLRKMLTYSVQPVFGGPLDEEADNNLEARAALHQRMNAFSAEKLERILNFLAESNGINAPDGNIVTALVRTGILENRREGLCITSSGFQFLLKDSFAQLWVLVRSLIVTQFTGKQLDALELVFRLSFACPGRQYRDDSLNQAQIELLAELHELGVVMLEEDFTFRPTLVGVQLLSSASRLSSGPTSGANATVVKTAGEIEIFVETNFRVYAYTTSNFQTNLLALFTHMRYRLPSMVVGHLTRDAVRRALMNGITADQIIGYLNAHAHPRMKKGVIPANVSDEIRLWEAEQDRVQTRPGVLLSEFQSEVNFDQVLEYSNDLGATLWNNPSRKMLVVDSRSYEHVKRFVKTNGIQ